MKQKLTTIYYSPTNTTKKVLKAIAEGIAFENTSEIDLIKVEDKEMKLDGGLAIIGVPVYSGRVPVGATKKINLLKASKVQVVLVAVYGNREYEDALIEMYDLTLNAGFIPVAAASFIGEHSYSTKEFPIAAGRPDRKDLQQAVDFGHKLKQKLMASSFSLNKLTEVPGNRPYKELKPALLISPLTLEEKCDKCGVCVSVCPTNAITLNDEVSTSSEDCIHCCACIKYCPNDARFFDNENIDAIRKRLFEFCSERKEPTFLFS